MSKSHRKLSKYAFLKENFERWWTVLYCFTGSSARNFKRVSILDMSQSVPHRTRLHGKILAITSFPSAPRPPHRPPTHQAPEAEHCMENFRWLPRPLHRPPPHTPGIITHGSSRVVIDDSSISAPIPHNLKYSFWSLSQLHVCCGCQTGRRQLPAVGKCARHSKCS